MSATILFACILIAIWHIFSQKKVCCQLRKEIDQLNTSLALATATAHQRQIQEAQAQTVAQEKEKIISTQAATIEVLQQDKLLLASEKASLEKLLEMKEQTIAERQSQQAKDMEETKKAFLSEFELLSNKLLKASSQEFATNSKAKIDELILPLKTRIETFQADILSLQKDTLSERLTLKANIKSIVESNCLLANQTDRLTKALRGDVQRQGAWGELILETVLQSSGLRKGEEYHIHGGNAELESIDGKRQYPDVIINLPDNKHIIIDSKCPYISYDNYLEAATEDERASCLDHLVQSLQTHVKDLSEKKYSLTDKLNTPDLTLMFIPIEAMFSLAVQAKKTLFEEAWKRSIIIVSPANLFAILRTIESLWKIELQNKNAQNIAREGGLLYDKFVGLLKSLDSLKTSLNGAMKSYDDVMIKLEGKGSIISKIQKLKELGLKTKGTITPHLLENAPSDLS